MDENTSTRFNERSAPVGKTSIEALPPPVLPVEDYLAELMECGFSREQASEYLTTLVPLIWHIVDLGFRVDISELLLSWTDSGALDSDEVPNMETPSKAESEAATQ